MPFRTLRSDEQQLGDVLTGPVRAAIREFVASIVPTVIPIVQGSADRITALLGNYLLKTDAASTYSPVGHQHAGGDVSSGTLGIPVNTSGAVQGGTVSAAGAVSGGSVASSGDLRGATLYASGAPGYTISGTRVAAWWQSSDGRAGTASSSRRYKQDITPAGMNVDAILAIEVVHYHYIAEIRKRDDPTFEDYVGPDYKVATEVGVIAEQLHELGLWQFVVYQRENYTETRTRPVMLTRPVLNADTNEPVLDDQGEPVTESYEGEEEYTLYLDRLKLGDDGEPIPDGVHYELLALATIPVLQDHERRIAALEAAATPKEPS